MPRSLLPVCLALLAGGGPAPRAAAQHPVFVDVTQAAGIDFRHVHGGGPNPRRYYIETMGSGVAFVDYDRDGWLDLYFVNGQHLTDRAAPRATNHLYRNDGGRRSAAAEPSAAT
ncbi:MAG: hypothetical protein AB1505_24025, partial [Candidatus Latescibacterota bacterium]